MSEEQVLPEFATLKAAAEKATPGPWVIRPCGTWYSLNRLVSIEDADNDEEYIHITDLDDGMRPGVPDTEYLAAASPENILKLIELLAQSEAERERLRSACSLVSDLHSRACAAAKHMESQTENLRAELARERELHQEAVKKLHGFSKYCDCGTCAVMREVIALLESTEDKQDG